MTDENINGKIKENAMPIHTYEAIPKDKLVRQPDGSLLIKDATIFTPGVFVDSLTREPTNYSDKLLEESYDNWEDDAVYSKHSGGQARDITDMIGNVQNRRYDGGVKADILLHCKTDKSRDVASMVESGLVNAISPEQGGAEKWNSAMGFWEQLSVKFFGLAVVRRGANPAAKLYEKVEDWQPPEPEKKTGDKTDMETAEMEKKIAELEKALAEMKDKLSAANAKLDAGASKEAAQAAEKIKEMAALVEGANERIKALETAGANQKSNADGADKELEAYEPRAFYDPSTKTTRGL